MQRDRWRLTVTVAVVAALLLGLAGTGLGIKALRNTQSGPEPATSLLRPTNAAILSGTTGLAARPISANVTAVEFFATGGSLNNTKIATASASILGWTAKWDTTTVKNDSYTLVSVGYDSTGRSSQSSSIVVVVKNLSSG